MVSAKPALRADIETLRDYVEQLPDDIPTGPIIPEGTNTQTGIISIPYTNTSYTAQKKKVATAALAYKVDPPNDQSVNFNAITIEDVELNDAGPVFRSYGPGEIRNLTIRRIRSLAGAYRSKQMGLVTIGNTYITDALFEDLYYVGAGVVTDKYDIPAGIALQGKDGNDGGERIIIRNFRFENIRASYSGYPNGDGVAIEATYSKALVQNGFVKNCVDAGYDFKAQDSRMEDVAAEGCRESFKIWSPGQHGALFSRSPTFAHVMAMGDANRFTPDKPLVIEHLDCRAPTKAPIFRCENGVTQIIVKSHNLSGIQPGTPILSTDSLAKGTTIVWEQGAPKF